MAETEVKDPESKPAEGAEDKTKHEPKEGTKRWDEIYAEAKQGKRDTEELQKKLDEQGLQIAAQQQHNAQLSEAVDKLSVKVSETDRPDPTLDPEAYEQWREDRLIAKLLKKTEAEPKPEPTAAPAPEQTSTMSEKLITQITVQRGIHSDYEEVVKEAELHMDKNAYLNAEIRGSEDPAAAAYKYGTEQREKAQAESNQNRGQGHVEGGSFPVGSSGDTLSAAQIKMAKDLGVSPERYAKNLEVINAGRR